MAKKRKKRKKTREQGQGPAKFIVALSTSQAKAYAKEIGVEEKWICITPSNYEEALSGLAIPRMNFLWADITWAFSRDMLDAISTVIRRGNNLNNY